jgi:hypothetical protein
MCRKSHIYYPGCGHTEDDILYMCPEASGLCRPCEHPIRIASARAREKLCPECRPPPETWPLMGKTAIGYLLLNFPLIVWLLISGLFLGICFIFQKVIQLFLKLCRLLHVVMRWLLQTTQNFVSTVIFGNQRLIASSKLFASKYLCPAVESALWWSVAIAMTPFIAILAILEILEDGLWPHLLKLFRKIVDFSSGNELRFYAAYFVVLSYIIAPASSVTRWLETITKVLAPFQVVKLYVWYWNEAWDSLGDFWAAFTLAAAFTSVLTSLVMTAPHASVLSFLNRWVYAIVFLLTIAEPVATFLGMLYAVVRAELPRLMKQEMVQKGLSGVVQGVMHNRLAWVWQITMSPVASLILLRQWILKLFRKRAAPAYQDNAVQMASEDATHTSLEPLYRRRGSYERVRPT